MQDGEVANVLEIGRALWAISSPQGGPRSATPETELVIWRWPLEGANKGKTANEAKRNETEKRHEANRGTERQATEHDNTTHQYATLFCFRKMEVSGFWVEPVFKSQMLCPFETGSY